MPSIESSLEKLLKLMRALRDPERGCPWTKVQAMKDVVPYTLEEAYEVVEAIEEDQHQHLMSELGDLLYQVVFYAQLADEQGWFDFHNVAQSALEKQSQRNPHDFDNPGQHTAEEITTEWEKKKLEKLKAQDSVLSGIATNLPGLTRAVKLQNRAATVGFDWQELPPVFDKLHEEIAELQQVLQEAGSAERIGEELGDVLFTCANLSRHLGQDPETVLRAANRKFIQRFQAMEKLAAVKDQQLADMEPEFLEALWCEAKLKA